MLLNFKGIFSGLFIKKAKTSRGIACASRGIACASRGIACASRGIACASRADFRFSGENSPLGYKVRFILRFAWF
jgi:hypothetical protein